MNRQSGIFEINAKVDSIAPLGKFNYPSKIHDPYSSHSVILSQVGDGQGRRLLDVGAAHGVLAEQFTRRGFEVTCIEGDPELAVEAGKHCQEMIVADLDKELPQLKGQFDIIVFGDILEHLREPMRVFRTLNRYLKAGGAVIVSVPNFVHLWVRLNVLFGRLEYAERGILDRTHLRLFTLRSFKRFLAEAGLGIEKLVATPVPLLLAVPQRYHGWWLRLLHALNAALARSWKTMFGYQFVAVARPGKTA